MLRSLLVANAVLQWADAASTLALLAAGAAEGNPLMGAVLEQAGVGGFLILKLGLAMTILGFLPALPRLRGHERRQAVKASCALAVMMCLVVAWNVFIVASL